MKREYVKSSEIARELQIEFGIGYDTAYWIVRLGGLEQFRKRQKEKALSFRATRNIEAKINSFLPEGIDASEYVKKILSDYSIDAVTVNYAIGELLNKTDSIKKLYETSSITQENIANITGIDAEMLYRFFLGVYEELKFHQALD